MIATYRISITGVVQGVGFRPFIARLAASLKLTGQVRNIGGSVDIIITTNSSVLNSFTDKILQNAPPGSFIHNISVTQLPQRSFEAFSIVASSTEALGNAYISVDLPICEHCESELYHSENRRLLHPFNSCTACGPRYSIIEALPYDRHNTTMRDFPMCEDCHAEYVGDDRRNHAQTISCHSCGPQLFFYSQDAFLEKQASLDKAIYLLKTGGVIAVKGVGGYHLVCSPFSEKAVDKLRAFKNRDKKPFAVMLRNIEIAHEYCFVSEREQVLLKSAARPIVLCLRKETKLCHAVYQDSRYLGIFMPYTALQCLLLDACGPLVFTSANVTNEPIIIADSAMLACADKLDGVLYNARRIVIPLDDSVAHIALGRAQIIRRSRGYIPQAIPLPSLSKVQFFASGGDLKAAFAYYKDGNLYYSQHFGDLENAAVFDEYVRNDDHLSALLNFRPTLAVCDSNPDYHSANYALQKGLPAIMAQHHHSHIASVMAEHDVNEVIGIAFDGTGYGDDGAVWGCEFMLCRGAKMKRLAHLDYIKVCGYNNAAKNAKLLSSCGLYSALGAPFIDDLILKSALDKNINTVNCGSIGRLFDIVADLLDICHYNSYEGECAILLENTAQEAIKLNIKPICFDFSTFSADNLVKIDQNAIIRQIFNVANLGEDKRAISLGFHRALAQLILRLCKHFKADFNVNKVALSGGVFQNSILLESTFTLLANCGFNVYINEKVPTNDGGIALGQAYIALKTLEEK